MDLKPGLKLKSAGSTAEFIVIRGAGDAELTVAGALLDTDGSTPARCAEAGDAVLIGKRYSDPDGTVELLCTQGGPGPLRLNGIDMTPTAAKALPSSD